MQLLVKYQLVNGQAKDGNDQLVRRSSSIN